MQCDSCGTDMNPSILCQKCGHVQRGIEALKVGTKRTVTRLMQQARREIGAGHSFEAAEILREAMDAMKAAE